MRFDQILDMTMPPCVSETKTMAEAFMAADLFTAVSWPHAMLKAAARGIPAADVVRAAVYSAPNLANPRAVFEDGLRYGGIVMGSTQEWAKLVSDIWLAFRRDSVSADRLRYELRQLDEDQPSDFSSAASPSWYVDARRKFGMMVFRRSPEGVATYYAAKAKTLFKEDTMFVIEFGRRLQALAAQQPKYGKLADAVTKDIVDMRSVGRFLS